VEAWALSQSRAVRLIAWVENELGRIEIVAFRGTTSADYPYSRCISVLEPEGADVGCAQPRSAPFDRIGLRGWSAGASYRTAGAFGGDDAVEAVLITSSGQTVSMQTYRGLAYAIWPESWGAAISIAFFASDGSELSSLDLCDGSLGLTPPEDCYRT
jgi:hypothetical protein